MGLLKNWISFLPPKFKESDTYKVDGKGILERFLDICSNYIEEFVTPDIDNALDLIDLNNVPSIYLNYIWEYLGSIPFAYGVSVDKEKFDQYYNGLKSKEELEALSKIWTLDKKGPVVLSETRVRSILKYAITLTKIRGTKKFFETLFKLYGFECTISDPFLDSNPNDTLDKWVDDKPKYDSEYYLYDGAKFDEDPRCTQCFTVNIDIATGPFADKTGEYFYDSKSILYSGKYEGLLNLYYNVQDYNDLDKSVIMASNQEEWMSLNEEAIFTGNIPASLNDFVAFRRMLDYLFERYLPYNVKPHITFNGFEIDDDISIEVTSVKCYDTNWPNYIFLGRLNYVQYSVSITSKWPYTDKRYVVSGDGGKTWGKPYNEGDILTLYVKGTYLIKPYTELYTGDPVSLEIKDLVLNTWYKLGYATPFGTNFGPINKDTFISELQVVVTGIKYWEELNDSGNKVIKTRYVDVSLIRGKSYSKTTGENNIYTFTQDCTEDGLGIQTLVFAIVEKMSKQISIDIGRIPERAYGSISPEVVDKNYTDGIVTVALNTNWEQASKNLVMVCNETGQRIIDGGEWVITRDGVTNFYIDRANLTGDKKKDARIKSIIIEDSPEYPSKFQFKVLNEITTQVNIITSVVPPYIDKDNPEVSVNIELKVYKSGVLSNKDSDYDVGITKSTSSVTYILNCKEGASYKVNEACSITIASILDPSVKRTIRILDKTTSTPVKTNGLYIYPEYDENNNWDTNMWSTDFTHNKEVNVVTAKDTDLRFYTHLYIDGKIIIGKDIEISDPLNKEKVMTVQSGDLVELPKPPSNVSKYQLLYNTKGYIAKILYIKNIIPPIVDEPTVEPSK